MLKKKDILELAITIVLLFILSAIVIATLKRTSPAGRVRMGRVTPVLKQGPGVQNRGSFKKLQEESKNLKLRRDPFMPAGAGYIEGISVQEGLVLTGIAWNQDEPLAIINDALVRKGDRIGANKVVEIEHDKVTLNDGSRDISLTLD